MRKGSPSDTTATRHVARIRAVFDTLTVSTRAMVLLLENGRVLSGSAGIVPLEQLRHLFGTAVVVEGVMTVGPSGAAVHIEVESIVAARGADSVWANMPITEPLAGLDAWFGKWPGDKTDAQLSEALQDAS